MSVSTYTIEDLHIQASENTLICCFLCMIEILCQHVTAKKCSSTKEGRKRRNRKEGKKKRHERIGKKEIWSSGSISAFNV